MRMPQFTWRGGEVWTNIKNRLRNMVGLLRLTHKSLFYNEFTTCTTVMDTGLEPMFWFVDHFVRYLGPAFVVLVVCLTLSVVVIFYICLLPHQYEQSLGWTVFHVLIGHYFLVCIVYNYFKASFTNPGNPPEKISEVVSICKRCIGPKPPRAHHCSVCNSCILKMDHHCPWLNNCVGHNNQRYFFLFCMYMWIATVYVSAVAYPMFKQHFYGDEDPGPSGVIYPFYLAKKTFYSSSKSHPINEKEGAPELGQVIEDKIKRLKMDTTGLSLHTLIIYEFMLCSAVSFALGFLLVWQCRLISYGETSIEWHINKRECKRLKKQGQVYKNPYHFGIRNNWSMFLGISEKGSFLTHVLLPSSHAPEEDGLTWKTSTYTLDHTLQLL